MFTVYVNLNAATSPESLLMTWQVMMTLKLFSGPESVRNPDLTHGFFSFLSFFFFFFEDFIYLFLERRERREKEGERNIYVWLPPMCPLLGT